MSSFSHVVVGGGLIGMAVGSRLARQYGPRVLVLEKNDKVGQEISSRNSEVIHAGIYHPPNSLKTKMCIRGKELTYALAKKRNLQVRNCGKWIVAQDETQAGFLEKMKKRTEITGVPLRWVPIEKAKELEPAIIAQAAILESPSSGIMNVDNFINYHQAKLQSYEGRVVTNTKVVGLEKTAAGYSIDYVSAGEPGTIVADAVVNCAGLYAPTVSNMLLPEDRRVESYFGKGTYFSYNSNTPRVRRLIYPCPPTDNRSLGTHLTLDMQSRIRFGPDFEWTDSPDDLQPSDRNLEAAKKSILEYMEIDPDALTPDYVGIRPKISKSDRFQDFVVQQEDGFPGFINLLNIESPGLTASMAIAEYVDDLLG